MHTGNEMSRQILQLAQQGLTRHLFLEKLSAIILEFTTCDALEIRLADKAFPYIWQYDISAAAAFRECSFIRNSEQVLIPCLPLKNSEEYICNELFLPRWNPELKYYYQKQSINIADGYNERHYLLEGEKNPGDLTGFASLLYLSFITGNNVNGMLSLKKKEKDFFSREDAAFCESLANSLGIAIAFQRSQYTLRERVKELTCLHSMNKLLQEPELDFSEIAQRLVNMLPASFQYPEFTCCRLTLNGSKYTSAAFSNAGIKIRHGIYLDREKAGDIEVFHNNPADHAFLPEEIDLLDSICSATSVIFRKLKIEAEKKVMQEQLRHADRLATIGQLAAGVAHELNEPLANVLGYAELMLQECSEQNPAFADLEKIVKSSLHAREVVRKLLLFARQMPTLMKPVNLNDLVEESIQFLGSRFAKNAVNLRFLPAADLPEFLADPSQIKQLIINLLVNAQQAMPKGGSILLTTLAENSEIILKIKDSGIGISKKILKKIYLPFFTTKQPGEGTGLGLSVVYGIVNAHSGKIKVDSELEKGTEFTVTFPKRQPHGGGGAY